MPGLAELEAEAVAYGVAGALDAPSAYLMKSPPRQIRDDEAHDLVERFIERMAAGRAAGAPS